MIYANITKPTRLLLSSKEIVLCHKTVQETGNFHHQESDSEELTKIAMMERLGSI